MVRVALFRGILAYFDTPVLVVVVVVVCAPQNMQRISHSNGAVPRAVPNFQDTMQIFAFVFGLRRA